MRKIKRKSKMQAKKGQAMIVGIMILIMAMIIFIATLPAVKSVMDDLRGCSYLNCAGYTDRNAVGASCTATNQSYTSTLEQDTLSCTVISLGIPYLILGVLVGLVGKLISGRLTEEPASQGYAGGY